MLTSLRDLFLTIRCSQGTRQAYLFALHIIKLFFPELQYHVTYNSVLTTICLGLYYNLRTARDEASVKQT